ncbi:MAG: hypothetical protein DWQ08_02485 [Proteobacteria bacterium]|nr:MAG: hypothetical protein DWQ08_02485 [Pseudomonadota bacterium]
MDITVGLLATADATLLNGAYEYLERSGYLGYLGGGTYEGAEAYAIVDVDIRAAGNVDIVGDLVVNAKSLSSGEHNSDAEVQANLYLEAGREPYSMYLGEDSHSSAAINITGNIDVNVDGDYRGWGLGSADVEANVYMEAAGDIVIDGDVTLIADADASSVSQVFVVAGEDGQSPEAVDIDNYLPDFRYEYLGVDDADANIDFYAFAGTHSGGTFDMKGDFNATATATLNGGYLGCAFMSSVECVTANDNEADIDVRIYSVGDVKYEGDITLLASATASGEMPNEAVTDVYLDIRAGIYGEDHDNSSAQITVTGDIIASGNASWSGGSYLPYLDGSADTFVSVYLAAAGDITIDGDLTLNAIGTADAREYAGHAEDAEANAYLTINAGTHSGGTADIEGDINVTARATAYDAIHGEEVYAQNTAEAGVYIDAVSDVNIVGDITVTGIVDVNDGGEGYAVAYLSLDAGDSDHEDNSEASLTVTGDILVSASADRTLDTDDEYIGNETVAYAWVDFDASRDITVNGDLEINATARGSNTGEDGSGAPVEVWADAYLSVDAGEKNNRGDFALNGDLAMTASATKLLADEHDSYDGGQADADVYVYIQAADDVDMENIYLASRALSDGTADNPFGGEGEASAWTYLHIEAGDDIDITGDIEGYANAEYYGGEGAASADATINTYLEAGDSIAIDGDIVLVSRAISSGDDSDGPDGGEGHTDLTIIAGESSDGYLEIRGDVYVAALAYGARTEGRDVTADAHVEMFAAGDLSIDGDVTVYAGADAENSNSAWADAELYLQAGAHGSDGSLDIEGDIYVMADAYYYADADNEEAYGAYANATVDFNAADDIRIRGDVNAYAWAFATGFGEDSSSVGDASARTYLSIEAGTHSSGAIDMEGDLSAYASAYLRDGTYLADAVSRVELTAANNIRVAGDIHVEADAATYGGGFEYFGGIYLGSDAYIGSTFVGNEYLPVNALAYLTVGAGDAFDNSHDDNSNASILIDGDVNVEAANEFFGEYGFMYLGGADHYLLGVGVLGFGAGGVYGGAMTYTELQAAEDIVIDGDLRTDAHTFTVGGYDAKAINLTLGYAGSHSDGDFTVTGSIDMGADAYMYGFGTPIGEDMFPLAVAAGNFVAAEDFVVGDDIRLSTYAYGSANEGAGAVSYLNVYGAAHGEDSSQVGGIFVGGDVHVEANAFHDSEEAVAWSIINMEAADSHEGYDNDIVIVGETRAEAFAYGGSSADGYAFASIYLAAGDDIFASPVAIAASSASAGTSVTARCDAGGTVSIPGGEVCVDSYADPDRLHNAYLFVRYHGVFDDEVPETPKPDEVVGTPGGGGTPPAVPPGVTPPAPTPPLEVIQRTVESWLAAIWGYPEYVEGLPPGIAEGFTVDPTGKVTFTQSFGDYFKGAYDSGICNYMNCPPSVEDAFGQAAGELQDTDTTADPDLVREGAPGNLEREVGDAGTTTTGRSS